jgi:hypothetical protein
VLVVDSVETPNGSVQYHLEIQNGQIPIWDIRTRTRTPEFVGSEAQIPMPRQLVPGGKISIPGLVAVIRSGKHNNVIVNVAYKAIIHHQEKNLWSTSRFLLGPEIKPSLVHPESVNNGEGELAYDEESKNIDFPAQFAEPQGTFAVVLSEINKEGKPNLCAIRNERREFLFDPEARVVVFKVTNDAGGTQELSLPLGQSNNSYHVIIVCWNVSGGFLSVDNSEARTPNFIDKE